MTDMLQTPFLVLTCTFIKGCSQNQVTGKVPQILLQLWDLRISGGTSVSEALACPPDEKRMIVSLDLSQMACILLIDITVPTFFSYQANRMKINI